MVITAETGTRAFLVLRDFSRAIDWLYTRAALPGLIDGWILADAYHDRHADRPVILAGAAAGLSSQGDIVLNQPTPKAVFDALRRALACERTRRPLWPSRAMRARPPEPAWADQQETEMTRHQTFIEPGSAQGRPFISAWPRKLITAGIGER